MQQQMMQQQQQQQQEEFMRQQMMLQEQERQRQEWLQVCNNGLRDTARTDSINSQQLDAATTANDAAAASFDGATHRLPIQQPLRTHGATAYRYARHAVAATPCCHSADASAPANIHAAGVHAT